MLRLLRSAVVGSLVIFGVGQLLRLLVPSQGSPGSSTFRRVAIMGGDVYTSSANPLAGGEVAVIMGGADVDLREASPSPAACVRVFVKAGAARIRVPDSWRVEADVDAFSSDVRISEAASEPSADAPRLEIRGQVLFGALAVQRG